MKMKHLMLFVAAATMLFAACSKDEDTTAAAGDNQMIYNGKTYQGETVSGSIENANVSLSLQSFAEAFIFEINSNIDNLTSSHTYDLTMADPNNPLFFHIFLQSEDLDNENKIFDFQYQNAPHLWYFLDGDNVSGSSAFTSGTAVATLDGNNITLTVNGTLVNGKPLSFRIVAPKNNGNLR